MTDIWQFILIVIAGTLATALGTILAATLSKTDIKSFFRKYWIVLLILLVLVSSVSIFLYLRFRPTATPTTSSLNTTLISEPQLSPTSTYTPAPIPTKTPTPIPTLTPTPTPTNTPTPSPIPSNRTIAEIRTTLRSLMGQALNRSSSWDKHAGLEIVVDDAILHAQFDIAFDAALSGDNDSRNSDMLAKVARCVARAGWYSTARNVTEFILRDFTRQSVKKEIFDLEHQSLRETPPPLCHATKWIRMPLFD